MSQAQKINALIDKILTEELDSIRKDEQIGKGTTTYAGKNAEPEVTKNPNFRTLSPDTQTDVRNKLRTGKSVTLEEERETPSATEIAGKIAEMMDSLKAVSEGTQDVKMKKIADKAAMQLEAAKATLEALTAHEVMLQEKEHEMFVKQAGKKRKTIERYLNKKVKMPEVVEKLMKKMPEEKIADMLKKSNGELDEEKVAGAMMKVALKEGYITKKEKYSILESLTEGDYERKEKAISQFGKEYDTEIEKNRRKKELKYLSKKEIDTLPQKEIDKLVKEREAEEIKKTKTKKSIISDEEIEDMLSPEEQDLPEDEKIELVNKIRSELQLLSKEERDTLSQKEKDELVKQREEEEQEKKLSAPKKVPSRPFPGKSEEETRDIVLKTYKNQIIDRIAGKESTLARKLPNEWTDQDITAWEKILAEFEKRVSDNIADTAKKERLSKEDFNFDDPNEWVKYALKYGRSPMPSKLGPPPGLEGMPKKEIGKAAIKELMPKDTLILFGKEIDSNKGKISTPKIKELYDNIIKNIQGSFPEIYKNPLAAASKFVNTYESYYDDLEYEYTNLIKQANSEKNTAKIKALNKEFTAIDTALNYFKSDIYDVTQDFAVTDKYVLTDKGKEVMKTVTDPKERQKIFASGGKDEYIIRAPEKGEGVLGSIYGKYYNLANDIFAMIKIYAMAQEDVDSIVKYIVRRRESGQAFNKVERKKLKQESENAKKKEATIKNIIINLIRKGKGYGWDMEKFIKEFKKYSKFDAQKNAYDKYLKALRSKDYYGIQPEKFKDKEKNNIKENSSYTSSFDRIIEKLLNEAFGYFKDGVFIYYKKNMI